MSFEEEQIFMNELAVTAVNGNILVAKHIRELIEKKLCRPVSEDYMRLIQKTQLEKENAKTRASKEKTKKLRKSLKKTPRNIGATHKLKENDNRPLMLFFEDEAAFGRMNHVRKCWVHRPTRAIIKKQLVR